MAELTVIIQVKKKDGKAFMATTGSWYNVKDFVIPYLEKINKGDTVQIETEKKGIAQYVTKIVKVEAIAQAEAPKTGESKFKCPVCGKAMKDDKYPVCYMCNKAGKKAPETTVETSTKEQPKTEKPAYQTKYGSPEDIAGKEMGCALNAAATVASGQHFVNMETGTPDPDAAAEYVKIVATSLLDWFKIQK
jgi:uncharacterized C2H2 Zn-finger protein